MSFVRCFFNCCLLPSHSVSLVHFRPLLVCLFSSRSILYHQLLIVTCFCVSGRHYIGINFYFVFGALWMETGLSGMASSECTLFPFSSIAIYISRYKNIQCVCVILSFRLVRPNCLSLDRMEYVCV